MHAPFELAGMTADIFSRIRARGPRVHCITNTVAQQYTANMLLAAGAVPSMTTAGEEIASFVAGADALLVNLGTFDAERQEAVGTALGVVSSASIPWVLDPVFIDRSPRRAAFARDLLSRRPAAVRLNPSEFAPLFGDEATGETPVRMAAVNATIVALTGDIDTVTDGARSVTIKNGHPLMGIVTAMGCAGSALVAAALAVESDRWVATLAAVAALGVAGEVAALHASGPGSFAFAIIDALHALDRAVLHERLKVS